MQDLYYLLAFKFYETCKVNWKHDKAKVEDYLWIGPSSSSIHGKWTFEIEICTNLRFLFWEMKHILHKYQHIQKSKSGHTWSSTLHKHFLVEVRLLHNFSRGAYFYQPGRSFYFFIRFCSPNFIKDTTHVIFHCFSTI